MRHEEREEEKACWRAAFLSCPMPHAQCLMPRKNKTRRKSRRVVPWQSGDRASYFLPFAFFGALMASRRSLPALKRTFFDAGMLIFSLVRGLRPSRALR